MFVESTPASKAKKREADIVVPFDKDYSKRTGYNADFLGKGQHRANLPVLSPSLKVSAAKLIEEPDEHVLKYLKYSVAVHAERRLAIYSAANVDFGQRFRLSRSRDVWRTAPRILSKHQLPNSYYTNNNFDRGHLTRNEDAEYGKTRMAALQAAADTCHWTNCTLQHSEFNQVGRMWQDIEVFILESTIKEDGFKAQVITGPVLDDGDPTYRGLQFPLQVWKVVAAVNSEGKLFATAYVASQKVAVDKFGIEAAPLEPFGAFKNHHVTIEEIERLTGLSFTSDKNTPLSEADPLAKAGTRLGRRRGVNARESAAFDAAPSGYVELLSVDDILL